DRKPDLESRQGHRAFRANLRWPDIRGGSGMRESLNEPVSVVWYYNARARRMQPHTLSWNNREYRLGKVDFWHKTWAGKHQIHHFSVADQKGQVYFKLALN